MTRSTRCLARALVVLAVLAVAAPELAAEPAEDAPTFSEDVFPILRANCQSCHRPGEVAPMALLTFKDARPWAKAIRRNVLARTMPPWNAEPGVGPEFHNDRSLSQTDIDTIVAWVDGGAPRGDADAKLEPLDYIDGWQLTPDEVIEIPPFTVPATGTVDYTYYIVPGAMTEDRWVTAAELRPSNREVAHHLIAYIRPPGSNYLRDYPVGEFFVPEADKGGCSTCRDGDPRPGTEFEFLVGYVPGFNPYEGPLNADRARLIPAGSDVIFEIHYTTIGEEAIDQPKLGLIYADEAPAERLLTTAVSNGNFVIPAGASAHRVDAVATTKMPVTLHALAPHMHLRGSAFRYDLVFADGTRQELLNVPRYDFNWQLTYFFEEPISLPVGTRIEATAIFDNSADNPFNPAPDEPVEWGDQSWEEMMVGFFDVSFDSSLDPDDLFSYGEDESDTLGNAETDPARR